MATRFDLQKLRRHTGEIRRQAEALTRSSGKSVMDAFSALSDFAESLEKQPRSLIRNVRLLITCRFVNHVYSALLLSEAGLTADALTCERTALETLAAFRLVTLAPEYAAKYETSKFPCPAKVREHLETLGNSEEIKHLKALYSSGSEIVHVTRANERFNTDWYSQDSAYLLFGGRFEERDHAEMLRFFPALIQWFIFGIGSESKE